MTLSTRTNRIVLRAASTALACFALGSNAPAAVINSTWLGGNDTWHNPAAWTPAGVPDNGANTYNAFLNAGISTVTQDVHVDSVSVSGGAQVFFPSSAPHKFFRTQTISLVPGGYFDINLQTCVVVDGTPDSTITSYLSSGRNGGAWNGSGITSTMARNNALGNTSIAHVHAGEIGYTTWDNEPVSPSSVLMRYTYMGDANFDGIVDMTDFGLVQNGFDNVLTGWYNGDFDSNGLVDGADFALWDLGFNTQSGQIVDPCVPEPSSLALVLAAAGLTTRRRRN